MLKEIILLPKNIISFIRATFAELKLVDWLKRNTVIKYTLFVVLFLFFGAFFLIVVDKLLLLFRGVIIPT